MKKRRSPSFQTSSGQATCGRGGFTLVEVLVSMAVLVLIIGMLAQVVGNATTTIQRSNKSMDSNQSAAVALDRIGDSIAGMVKSGEATLVAIKNPSGNDGLAMITNGRVRSRTGAANVSVDSFTNIRQGARGFCVINAPNPDLLLPSGGGNYPSTAMLHWGDATISWNAPDTTNVQSNPTAALWQAATDVQSQASNMLQFSPLSRSIFRFEIAFLLSDGTVVSGSTGGTNLALIGAYTSTGVAQAPLPRNRYFIRNEAFANPPKSFDAPMYPLALDPADSDAAPTANSGGENVFVRAVIVGIATLDPNSLRILSDAQRTQLARTDTLGKVENNAMPIDKWDISSGTSTTYTTLRGSAFPPTVLQNIRFTQRSFYVR